MGELFRATTLFARFLFIFLGLTAATSWQTVASQGDIFSEVPAFVSGVDWRHHSGRSDQHYLPETMGPGAALLDYDGDGWLDLYLVNSGPSDFFQPRQPLRNALYRNRGDGSFIDVTLQAGVEGGNFGMGAAAADFDNDGDQDLFVTGYGKTLLYLNRGDGTFKEWARQAGVEVSGWTTSAVWFDFDNDGWLDLFVCSFVVFGADRHISCGLNALGKAYYCVPRVFQPTTSFLFRNNRNGTFTRVDGNSAIGRTPGKALGAVAADLNNDGWLDLFVANDTVQDFLFFNRGQERFEESALFAGVGFSIDGEAQSGMGVDAADFDQNGFQDLYVANIDHQYYSLFLNRDGEVFTDEAITQGVGQPTFLLSGWGLKFVDYDNDADLDLLIANGHPDDMIAEYAKNVTYREPMLLFENRSGRLHDISASAGKVFAKVLSARGLALGDYDNDGRSDAVVTTNAGGVLILRNTAPVSHHWLGVKLQGNRSNRDAIGARLSWSAGGRQYSRHLNSGGSYLSSHDRRLLLGLGKAQSVDWLEIRWPSGTTQRLEKLEVDRYLTVEEPSRP